MLPIRACRLTTMMRRRWTFETELWSAVFLPSFAALLLLLTRMVVHRCTVKQNSYIGTRKITALLPSPI